MRQRDGRAAAWRKGDSSAYAPGIETYRVSAPISEARAQLSSYWNWFSVTPTEDA
jgi:hypothetical protein